MTKDSFVAEVTFKHMVLIITQGRVWLNIWWFMIHSKVLNFHNWNFCYEPFHDNIFTEWLTAERF